VALRVTAIDGRNLQVVVVVDMAGRARNIGVAIGQRKPCCAVIEVGVQPTVKVVTALTIGSGKRRTRRGVHWIGRVLPVLQVAGVTLRGEAKKLSRGGLLVALLARYRRVCAK